MDPEQEAMRTRYKARVAFQKWLDSLLAPISDVPAEQIRANWKPYEQLQKGDSDVGFEQEAESGESRVN